MLTATAARRNLLAAAILIAGGAALVAGHPAPTAPSAAVTASR